MRVEEVGLEVGPGQTFLGRSPGDQGGAGIKAGNRRIPCEPGRYLS